MIQLNKFAIKLAESISVNSTHYVQCPDHPHKIQLCDTPEVTLDLTPFQATTRPVTAFRYFSNIRSVNDLLKAYRHAKNDHFFEDDIIEATAHLSDYASLFLNEILDTATQRFSDNQAIIIANWVKHLDVYAAVKAVESLLNSCADLKLLELAPKKNWHIHFDHLAIRCGSKSNDDAERLVQLLTQHHDYTSPQLADEAFYQFPDGWNAYPLYKILDNGQILRVFIDQSDANAPEQIIQHWNRVYGYTAHHLAMRATQMNASSREREAVSLDEIISSLEHRGISTLTPTGHYTHGLLLQVFTKPEKNSQIPQHLKEEITSANSQLEKIIENGKLLELVSRAELPYDLAQELYALYDLKFDLKNPIHSAPIYQYFLPAQAAHVIKTSVQT